MIAFGIGLLAGAAALLAGSTTTFAILLAADLCFALYLGLDLQLAASLTPALLRQRATDGDEGVPLILFLALGTVAVSLTAIISVFAARTVGDGPTLSLALASIPLGWAVLQTMAAFHYAHLYYAPNRPGGIVFPAGDEAPADPGMTEFLYFAFTIGMTAQVSDTTITRRDLRRAVLLHGIGSFFYNATILALAVSAALSTTA